MNINNFIIKTKLVELYWFPLLFGFFNVVNCLHKLNNIYKIKITKLQVSINNTNNKYNELQNKYDKLYAEFQELNIKFNYLNNTQIHKQIIKTDTSETNTSETNTSETNTSETNTSETNTSETNTSETNTSETNTSETDTSINLLETQNTDQLNDNYIHDIINSPSNDINSEFIDSLSLDYNNNDKYIDNITNTYNSNWSNVTKRFFFG
jgi:hypothetical protein